MALRIGRKSANGDTASDITPPTTGDNAGAPAPQRKGIKPLFLVLGIAIIAALGGGAYMMFAAPPAEEEFIPPPLDQRPPAPTGVMEGAPPPPDHNAPGSPPPGVPSAGSPPAGAPPAPGVIRKPAVGMKPPTGGKPAGPAAIPPQMKAQLKQLWDNGAAAKHRNDYKTARAAWQKILQLRPGHPGIQDAIDKLPPR